MFQNKRLLIFLLVTLIGSGLVTQQSSGIFSAYASESSAYESGRDHGCDDARLNPSDRYINEPGKGPSFHTSEFMSGYYDGLNSCGGGGGGRDDGGQPPPSQTQGFDWFAACQAAHLVLGLQTPCNELVNPDNTLTDQGDKVLLCYGGGLLLALKTGGLSALGSDELARAAGCPK